MADGKTVAGARPKISRVEVYWHTVKYRTVVLLCFPSWRLSAASLLSRFPRILRENIAAHLRCRCAARQWRRGTSAARQARFVNLDGKVQVKKVNSVQWVNADYQMTLDKGDLIQTGPGRRGAHRIRRRHDVHRERRHARHGRRKHRRTGPRLQVAVHITSGQVDLAYRHMAGARLESGSLLSRMRWLDAQANSRAAVRSDPNTNEQQITVDAGSAELNRGNEHVDIGQYERATFHQRRWPITKTQVLAPPELTEPLNLQPIIVADPQHDPVHFSWKPRADGKDV